MTKSASSAHKSECTCPSANWKELKHREVAVSQAVSTCMHHPVVSISTSYPAIPLSLPFSTASPLHLDAHLAHPHTFFSSFSP